MSECPFTNLVDPRTYKEGMPYQQLKEMVHFDLGLEIIPGTGTKDLTPEQKPFRRSRLAIPRGANCLTMDGLRQIRLGDIPVGGFVFSHSPIGTRSVDADDQKLVTCRWARCLRRKARDGG